MPTDALIVVILVLAVFGFFMAVLGYASFAENRQSGGRLPPSARKRRE